MANTFVKVNSYKVFTYGGPNGNSNADASISLGIPPTKGWAFLRFFRDGVTLPTNKVTTHMSGKPIYYVNYRYDQFAPIVDILRNEDPIKFFFNGTSKAAYLTTADEPVGEGEFVGAKEAMV